MRPSLLIVVALTMGCFTPGDPSGDTDDGSTSGGTTAGVASATMPSTSSATPGTGSQSATTNDPTTDTPTSDSSTTDDPTTGPTDTEPGECGAGLSCLNVPMGWEGPLRPELGIGNQCDDTSLPAFFAGIAAAWDEDCSCNCAATAAETCVGEWYGGGEVGSCDGNDELLGTCTATLPIGGNVICDVGVAGCLATEEEVAFDSYYSCGEGVGATLDVDWTSGYRLCDPDDAIGSPCTGGQCSDPSAALCVVSTAKVGECPADFPERTDGFQSFSQTQATCGCDCRSQTDCLYQTWYESGCGVGGGDDDPVCAPPGAVRFLDDFPQPPGACSPAVADIEEPPFPFDEAITLCCTIAI